MRTIIAGSRQITDYSVICDAVKQSGWMDIISVVISGTAKGVDILGEDYAYKHGLLIERYKADWSLGRSAGFIRNEEMASVADALIAVWNGTSKGTSHMIQTANRYELKVFIHRIKEDINEDNSRHEWSDYI